MLNVRQLPILASVVTLELVLKFKSEIDIH